MESGVVSRNGGAAVGLTPLAATAARLTHLDEDAGFEVGVGGDWVDLARLESDGHLDSWLAVLVARHGHRGKAGSDLGGELARAVVGPTVSSLVLDGRCPDPGVDNVAVKVEPDGSVSRTGVRGHVVAVLSRDAAASDLHSLVLADEAALHAWWARRVAATLLPLLAAVRARAPFGLPALWGSVSDEVSGCAIWIGQLAGREQHESWRYAQRLLDALAPYAPVRLTRARPFPVAHRRGERLFQVRGTCCLSYRSAEVDGPEGDRYCSTCPLRDDGSRCQLLRDYLDTL
jgi:hypothetical protein